MLHCRTRIRRGLQRSESQQFQENNANNMNSLNSNNNSTSMNSSHSNMNSSYLQNIPTSFNNSNALYNSNSFNFSKASNISSPLNISTDHNSLPPYFNSGNSFFFIVMFTNLSKICNFFMKITVQIRNIYQKSSKFEIWTYKHFLAEGHECSKGHTDCNFIKWWVQLEWKMAIS